MKTFQRRILVDFVLLGPWKIDLQSKTDLSDGVARNQNIPTVIL